MENELVAPNGAIKKNRLEPAEKTYFFQRHDGSIINVKEQEAWNLLKKRQPVLGLYVQPPKLIGVSNGTLFRKAVEEAHALHAEGKVDEAVQRIRDGEKEELASAMGKIEMPRNFDTIDQNRRPVNLNF